MISDGHKSKLASPASVQRPGCLPDGGSLDSLLTIKQFACWRQVPERRVRALAVKMPGVIKESRKDIRVHPRTYLAARLPGSKVLR